MAYKEVLRVEIQEVIRRWQRGSSQRQIAEGTGLSRATVRNTPACAGAGSGSGEAAGVVEDGPAPEEEQLSRLAGISQAGPRRVETPVEDSLSPWADQIYQWLTGDRLTVTRIQELLAARGCTVSYTSLRRFIVKRNWGRRSVRTVRMADTPAGELAEADFGRLGIDHRPGDGPAPRGVGADHRAVLLTPLFRLAYVQSEAGGRDRRPGGSVGVLRRRAQESGHR